MLVTLINPPMISVKNDLFGDIPAIPVGLLYLAAAAKDAGHKVEVIDAWGLASNKVSPWKSNMVLAGLTPGEIMEHTAPETRVVGISAHSGLTFSWIAEVIRLAKKRHIPVVLGGPFATTMADKFVLAGADYVVLGEGEKAFVAVCRKLEEKSIRSAVVFDGPLVSAPCMENPDSISFPAYELLNLSPYYLAGRSHAPFSGPYFPLVTSRGCPYQCAFCATPKISGGIFRSRSADDVVNEMAFLQKKYGVSHFSIQDDNFTTSAKRVKAICNKIREKNLAVRFSLPSGIRTDNVDTGLMDTMAEAGLHFVAFAPESGSARVRRLMNKPVNIPHVKNLIVHAGKRGIATQAFILLGYPGETAKDRKLTARLVRDLAKLGIDDVSLFIMAPIPGSKSQFLMDSPPTCEGLCWSPVWRPDFAELQRARMLIYLSFFICKLFFRPIDFIRYMWHIITGKYRSKGEMVLGWALRNKIL